MEMTEWERMAGGDQIAFINIYQSNYPSLLTYGFTLTANLELTKDCIQEMFLELWKKHAAVNKDVSDVRSYLFTWLRRKISKEQASVNKHAKAQNFEQRGQYTWSYEELLIAFQQTEESKAKLTNALKKLTKRQLEIIELRFFENLSYEEIAAKTSLTQRTVYNLVYEAVRHLREYMHAFLLLF